MCVLVCKKGGKIKYSLSIFDIYKKFMQRRLTFAITNLEFSLSLLDLCIYVCVCVCKMCVYIYIYHVYLSTRQSRYATIKRTPFYDFFLSVPSANTGQKNSLALARRERTENPITRRCFLVVPVLCLFVVRKKEPSCRKDRIIRY